MSHYKNLIPINNHLLSAYGLLDELFEGNITPENNSFYDRVLAISDKLNKFHSHTFLRHVLSFLVPLINKGNLNHIQLMFKLYRYGVESGILDIDIPTYRNISYIACQVQEFEWALNFVEQYKSQLPDNDQQSAHSFTKARTFWYAKDWEGVIRTLRNVEYKDMTYNLLARSYILTCYFELDDYEPLDSLIKSFKVYLRRKRNVSKARKDSFYNFITALDHLMKASERSDYKRIIKAKEVIANNPSTRNKDWLTEKIEELEAIIPQPKSKSKAKA